MSRKDKNQYYVVWVGKKTGIFDNWKVCAEQVQGFPAAKYKGFPTEAAAQQAFKLGWEGYRATQGKSLEITSAPSNTTKATPMGNSNIIWDSIAVDAACSGNPGTLEYQGVDTQTGERIFHRQFAEGTNNIGEFLAIVHALALLKKQNSNRPIYSDSRTALAWVKQKKVNTQYVRTEKNVRLFEFVDKALIWLHNNSYNNPLLKWETELWGEIPADFGRK